MHKGYGASYGTTREKVVFYVVYLHLKDRVSDALPFIAISLSSEDKVLSLFSMLAMVFFLHC